MSYRRALGHDKLIDLVVKRMWSTGRYRDILTTFDYDISVRGKQIHGEADIIGITTKGNACVYEIKTFDQNKSYKKARQQLYKDRTYLRKNYQKFGLRFDPQISLVYVANNRVRKVT